MSSEINKQDQFRNAMMVAQSYQMTRISSGLKNVSNALSENTEIQKSILLVQSEIKKTLDSQMDEIKKSNALKKFEIEQNELKYKQERAERDYIRHQRNLAFELKNSVEEIDSNEDTILEKFFYLKTSEDLFKELDTQSFEINEMEYAKDAQRDITNSRKKYEGMLSKQDKKDLNSIESIEQEDENILLNDVKNKLKDLEIFKKNIKKIHNINLKKQNPNNTHKLLLKIINDVEKQKL